MILVIAKQTYMSLSVIAVFTRLNRNGKPIMNDLKH